MLNINGEVLRNTTGYNIGRVGNVTISANAIIFSNVHIAGEYFIIGVSSIVNKDIFDDHVVYVDNLAKRIL